LSGYLYILVGFSCVEDIRLLLNAAL